MDFTILIADSVIPMVRRQSGQYAVAFPVGPVLEMGWAFRKEDKDLQAAAEKFFQTQRTQKDSLLNKQFKNLYDMSVNEFSEMVSGIK